MVSIALASAASLTCIGIYRGIGLSPSLQRLMIGLWTSGLLLFVAGVAFLIVIIAQYVEVRERTQDYGVLRVLGASRTYFAGLLVQESLLIAIPGTALGIALTWFAQEIVAVVFSRYLTLEMAYWCWPLAGLCSVIALMAGGLIGIRSAVSDGMEEALSYHKR
jgi:putative ABC transport system permease protein